MQPRTVMLSLTAAVLAFALYMHARRIQLADPLAASPPTQMLAAGESPPIDEEQQREICTLFRLQYRIATINELHKLPASIQPLWDSWKCSSEWLELPNKPAAVSAHSNAPPSTTPPLTETSSPSEARIHAVDTASATVDIDIPECVRLMVDYDVRIGESWGSLPEKLQSKWIKSNCDSVASTWAAAHPGMFANLVKAAQPTQSSPDTTTLPTPGDVGVSPDEASGSSENERIAKCTQMMHTHGIKPGESWGTLPMNLRAVWKQQRCDVWYWTKLQMSQESPTCPAANLAAKEIIAVMAGSTSRKVEKPSTNVMALFKWLLPSLARTLDCGFKYLFILGYDVGDPFYDSESGMTDTKNWFEQNVKEPLLNKNIYIEFRVVRVNNVLKKPGPVFLEMGRDAYNAGADYFYRVNDDTQMMHAWPKLFVKALQSLGPPYGVVGPFCAQGNSKILTHDFTARIHMDIFGMNYYPPQLSDWWMDDWVSFVYGSKRTFKITKAKVIHHTGTHGQRYQVDPSHQQLVKGLVAEGRQKIREYMLKHNIEARVLKEFDEDRQQGPPFRDFNIAS